MGWAKPDFNDSEWKDMELPTLWEKAGLAIDGAVWFRTTVDIPESWAGKEVILSLGPIDDFDTAYLNGEIIGQTGEETERYWEHPRKYNIPPTKLKTGKNSLVIRAYDHIGDGGFSGAKDDMQLIVYIDEEKETVSLAGNWKFKVEVEFEQKDSSIWGTSPQPPKGKKDQNSPTMLYNGMLHPLHPMAFKGVIWYQGESNAWKSYQYRLLFAEMIKDWRELWGRDFPFYFVQLANFMQQKPHPGESTWAELREAQSMALSLTNTGQAVIIDIGEANDIHPKNKKDVGLRLALNALAKTYGQDIVYSGPVYESMKIERNTIHLKFKHIGSGLEAKGGTELKGFAIAGEDKKFVWAKAQINGDIVIVSNEEVRAPAAVRYAWSDNPECNLYNKEGLPASPFRTDDWQLITRYNK